MGVVSHPSHVREIEQRERRIAHLEAELEYKTEMISTLLDKLARERARSEEFERAYECIVSGC